MAAGQGLSNDQKKVLEAQFFTRILSSTGIDEINKGIRNLTGSALQIDRDFGDIAVGFSEAERVLTAEPHYTEILKLRKRWESHHKEYVRLMWLSRTVAGRARATLSDFADNLIAVLERPDTVFSFNEKIAQIAIFEKMLAEDERDSTQGLSQGFTDLRNQVRTFKTDFHTLLEDFKQRRIPQLDQEIKKMDDALKNADFHTKVSGITVGLSTTALLVMGGLTGLFTILGFVCPPLLVAGIAGMITMGVIGAAAGYALIKSLSNTDTKRLLEEKRDAYQGLVKAEGVLIPLEAQMDDIFARLGVFASVWAAIGSEIGTIKNLMQKTARGGGTQVMLDQRYCQCQGVVRSARSGAQEV